MGFLLIIYFYAGNRFMSGVSVQHFNYKATCEAAKKVLDKEHKSGIREVKCVELKP